MEILNEIIDEIKTGKTYDQILSEFITVIKLFLKKNPAIADKEFQKLIKTIGGSIRRECPNAFPILNFLTRLITTSKKITAKKSQEAKSQDHTLLFRMLTENIKTKHLEASSESVSHVLEILSDLNDFETITEEIISVAKMHIHNNEVILVYGHSELMREFVLSSLDDHQFSLIIVKNSIGECLALREEHKSVVYISENSVGSIMNKVSKVFIDCHSVMADGAVINTSGSYNIAVVAKEYSIPVIVLAPMHNFTPFYAFSQETYNEFMKPQIFFPKAYSAKSIEVQIAKFDLIASDYITMLITQYGEYSNSYVYRAFSEYYGEGEYGYEF